MRSISAFVLHIGSPPNATTSIFAYGQSYFKLLKSFFRPQTTSEAVQLLQRDSRRRDGQEPNPLPGSGGPCKITVAPCVYLDKNQVVVGWHLPEALQSARLVSWYSALESAARDGNSPFWTSPEGDWRSNEELFEDSPNFPFGHVDLSPAGFYQDNQAIPTPSTSFTSPGRNGWGLLNDIQETLSIFGAVLAIVQPSVFYEGLNLFEKIYTRQTQIESTWAFRDLLALWGAPFTNVLIFSNHEAPFHRDLSSCPYAFEVFVSTGTSRNNRFVIPSFDMMPVLIIMLLLSVRFVRISSILC
ncbi:hypothetical protein CC2G_015071 [Coprinopsis cinerea AmutBmut pab1-1]|nr:hypothetical protein CC2G_015071 [Coprinopsis cinerea AmutBmut pab1-1]